MSGRFYAKTVLGFEVSKTDFLQSKSELTPEFLKWGATVFPNEQPEEYWGLLCDSFDEGQETIRIIDIPECGHPDRLVLGFVLGTYSDYYGNSVNDACLVENISALTKKLEEAARALKVMKPVAIFTIGFGE